MPFKGDNPLGTAGGLDLYNAPQFPRIYAVADGPMYILVMRLNGDLYERNRENVEDVIRVIGLRGENLAGFIVRHSGGVVESSATDLDFDQGFTVGQIAPGVVVISVGSGAIVTAMLAPDAVQNAQLADNAVQRENILSTDRSCIPIWTQPWYRSEWLFRLQELQSLTDGSFATGKRSPVYHH
jgi:hypothetical protein